MALKLELEPGVFSFSVIVGNIAVTVGVNIMNVYVTVGVMEGRELETVVS